MKINWILKIKHHIIFFIIFCIILFMFRHFLGIELFGLFSIYFIIGLFISRLKYSKLEENLRTTNFELYKNLDNIRYDGYLESIFKLKTSHYKDAEKEIQNVLEANFPEEYKHCKILLYFYFITSVLLMILAFFNVI